MSDDKPVLSWMNLDDEEDQEWAWEDLMRALTILLKEVNPDGFWFCEVSNFGWRNISGEAYFEFDDGSALCSKVLPKTDCHFNIFREDRKLRIQNFHHDSPVGNEWYTLTPLTEEAFDKATS